MSIDLKRGNDPQTLLDNALALIAEGHSKGQAMAHALNAAGYRPQDCTLGALQRANKDTDAARLTS